MSARPVTSPVLDDPDATVYDRILHLTAQLRQVEKQLQARPDAAGLKATSTRIKQELAVLQGHMPKPKAPTIAPRDKEHATGPVLRLVELGEGDRFCYAFNPARRGRVVRIGTGSVSVRMDRDKGTTITTQDGETVSFAGGEGIVTLAHSAPVRRLEKAS